MSTNKIPDELQTIAAELNLDLAGFERTGKAVDWPELFGFMHHWNDVQRDEEIEELTERFEDIERRLRRIENTIKQTTE